jgi:hypothetical protein
LYGLNSALQKDGFFLALARPGAEPASPFGPQKGETDPHLGVGAKGHFAVVASKDDDVWKQSAVRVTVRLGELELEEGGAGGAANGGGGGEQASAATGPMPVEAASGAAGAQASPTDVMGGGATVEDAAGADTGGSPGNALPGEAGKPSDLAPPVGGNGGDDGPGAAAGTPTRTSTACGCSVPGSGSREQPLHSLALISAAVFALRRRGHKNVV